MRPLKIVSLILASHYLSLGFAQEPAPPMQFGLISGEDLSMRFYEADTAAEALVLCDFGDAKVTLYPNGYRLRFAQHKRIKILKKSGFQDSIYTYERSQSSWLSTEKSATPDSQCVPNYFLRKNSYHNIRKAIQYNPSM